MKKQLAAAASGDQNVTRTLELIYGHITNTLTIMWLLKFSQKANYAEDVNVLEFFHMSQLNIIDGVWMLITQLEETIYSN